jgi:hypothetical protein
MVQPLAPISEQEVAAAFSGAAPAANRFTVHLGNPGVRISFLEQIPGGTESVFRSAVTLHPIDAISLARLLNAMLKEIENDLLGRGLVKPEDS